MGIGGASPLFICFAMSMFSTLRLIGASVISWSDKLSSRRDLAALLYVAHLHNSDAEMLDMMVDDHFFGIADDLPDV
ncbi:hypothetical protein PG987_008242 [Apiospora arundinis]